MCRCKEYFVFLGLGTNGTSANHRVASKAIHTGWFDNGAYAVHGDTRRWCQCNWPGINYFQPNSKDVWFRANEVVRVVTTSVK